MKKILFVLLLTFFVSGCFSSEYIQLKEDAKQVVYIEDHNLYKDAAYMKICEWMAKNYGSSKAVIQMQDKESGTIIGKALGTYTAHWLPADIEYPYNYTLSVKIKEGKVKFEFTITPQEYNYYPDDRARDQVLAYFNSIKDSIVEYLKLNNKDDF